MKFSSDEIRRFLWAMGSLADKRLRFAVIGGSAASLAFGIESFTKDIDLHIDRGFDYSGLEDLVKRTQENTGLRIPVEPVPVSELPYNAGDRWSSRHFGKIEILTPEKHDFFLMKIIRGYQHDIDHLTAIHERDPFLENVLIERFIEEMSHISANTRNLLANFLLGLSSIGVDEEKAESEIRQKAVWLQWQKGSPALQSRDKG